MTAAAHLPDTVRTASHYSIVIGFSGNSQGRFSTARMVSHASDYSGSTRELSNMTVIDRIEFHAILTILEKFNREFHIGSFIGDEPEYNATITADETIFSCGLGLSQTTIEIMRKMTSVVGTESRDVIEIVIEELQRLFNGS